MQVPVERIEGIVRDMFDGREAVTREEVLRRAAEAGAGSDAQSFLAQLPPGAFTCSQLLGDIRTLAAAYDEPLSRRTSDREP